MRLVIVLLVAVALVVALGLSGVLPIFGSAENDAPGPLGGEANPLEGEGGPKLTGIDGAPVKPTSELAAAPDEPAIPSRVKGSTRGGAQISGRVVFQDGQIPVEGATVVLRRVDSLFYYLKAEVNGRFDVLTARSDAEGRFSFYDITPADRYVVRAHAEGTAAASSPTLDLRGAEHVALEDDLALGRGGSFTGRVVDLEGKPIAGVRIVAGWAIKNTLGVVLSDPDTLPEIERETKTDAKGGFVLEALEPGEKTLIAAVPGGPTRLVHPRTAVENEVSDLGEVRMPRDQVLAGQVVWADGSPVVGAHVYAGIPNKAMHAEQTDAEGRFRVHYVPDGRLAVGVLVPGLPVQVQFGLEPGRDDLLFKLPPAGGLAGRVTREADGAPVADFKMQIEALDVKDMQMRFVEKIMNKALGPTRFRDEQGRYAFERVAAGRYRVTVEAPGFPKIVRDDVEVGAGGATEIDIELPEGNGLAGRVVHADGSPAAETRIYLFDAKGPLENVSALGLAAFLEDREPDTFSRGDGSFRIEATASGTYDIAFLRAGFLGAIERGVDLTNDDVEDLRIELPASGSVRGRLVMPTGGPAVGEQYYVLFPSGQFRAGEVDEDGRFEEEGLPVGHCLVRWVSFRDVARYLAVIRANDPDEQKKLYKELTQEGGEVFLTDGATEERTITLPRRVLVRGTVLIGGAPARHSAGGFYIQHIGGGPGVMVKWNESGTYSREIEAGRYRLWCPSSTGSWEMEEVEIPDQRSFTLDVERE